jgi:lipopolysaccharide export system protein LptA
MKIRLIFVLMFLLVNIAFSKEISSVKVESDSLVYSGDKNVSIFRGNVVAHYNDVTVKSDSMTVYFNKDKKVDKILCEGNVQVTRGDLYSLSEFADIDINTDKAVLRKNVKVWQGKNYLEGDEVIIYNKDSRVIVNKGESQRVKIIFYPEGTDNATKDNTTEKKIQR